MTGGINHWESEIAIGSPESGMELFSGAETIEETLVIGFGLEEGLRDFYLSMIPKVHKEEAKKLFTMLADIEVVHQKQLLKLYEETTGKKASREEFLTQIAEPAMEGGLSTEEYINLFSPDLNNELDILSLAMSIEAQALDLYHRAAEREQDEKIKTALKKIENEERFHISKLAEYIENMT